VNGAYYNEFDPFAAEWLRELIKAGHIADGIVDERSIEDVQPNDLAGFTQCHFFAGIGVWSYALRQAGWSDSRPVWTGSCPCQSFSAAGKGKGFDDTRHLWPAFYRLIAECRPHTVFGEQVEAAIRHGWLDLVQTDLEREGYAVGSVVFPSSGIGAPHIRSRLYWVADASREGLEGCNRGEMGRQCQTVERGGGVGRLADASYSTAYGEQRFTLATARPTNGFWRDVDWLFCRDGKWRPVEPGTFPLVASTTQRVGRLRGYGNAINAEAAKAFIEAFLTI